MAQSSGCVRLSAAQIIGSGAITKVLLDLLDWDNLGEWDAANNRVVIQNAGYYFLSSMGVFDSITGITCSTFGYIYKNGAVLRQHYLWNTAGCRWDPVPTLVKLNAGDVLELYAYQDSGLNQTLAASDGGGWYMHTRLEWLGFDEVIIAVLGSKSANMASKLVAAGVI